MRRFLILLLVLLILAVGGWLGYRQFWLPQQTVDEGPSYETVTVTRGSIGSTVNATGSIDPIGEVALTFRGAGTVAAVYVAEGQTVASGQLLAELDTTELTLALAQARVSTEISEAQLAKLESPPSEQDLVAAQAAIEVAQAGVAGAEAALVSAQAGYRDLLAGQTEEERLVNLSQVRQAEANLKRAQQAYNDVKNRPNVGALPQSTELEQATIAFEVARTRSAIAEQPPTEAEIAGALNQIAQGEVSLRQAQSNLITAQNNLQTLLDGADVQDLRISQAQLRQAQLSLLQAENSLNNARLVSPVDGIVSQVGIKRGEQAASGLAAVVVTDLTRFHMTVLVDEIDVRQVQVGQPVRIRVDALPDTELSGLVTEIAPTADDVGGVIAYAVTVTPDAADVPLRAGMSATAIITTAEVDDVVLVPNRYIQLDRDSGRAYVNKLVSSEPVLQEVELGLRNERSSQILAGVDDGDVLALVTRSSEEQLRGALFGGN